MNNTLDYYRQNAQSFIDGTLTVEFTDMQDHFLKQLPPHALILDFGCGSGRDTRYFLEKGFQVHAMDGCPELCRFAAAYTGIQVRQMLFQELNETEKYDGIWACSSILHLEKAALLEVLGKIAQALKGNGILYTSFKYGDFSGERNGRYFTDFTETSMTAFLKAVPKLWIREMWRTQDVRPDRSGEQWLNLILEKQITG